MRAVDNASIAWRDHGIIRVGVGKMLQIIKMNGEYYMREVHFTEELPSVPEVQSVLLKDESPTLPVGETSEDLEIIDQGEIIDPEFIERNLLIGSPDTEKKRLPIMTPEERMAASADGRYTKAVKPAFSAGRSSERKDKTIRRVDSGVGYGLINKNKLS